MVRKPTSGRARQTLYQLLSEVRTKKPHFEGLGKRFEPVTLRHTSVAAKLGNSCLSRLWPRSGVSSLRGRGLFIDYATDWTIGESVFESREGHWFALPHGVQTVSGTHPCYEGVAHAFLTLALVKASD